MKITRAFCLKKGRNVVAWTLATSVLAVSGTALAGEMESTLARGGQLYDRWWAVTGTDAPKAANPAYPDAGKYKGKKGADFRCKECHGWDYMGKDGAYASGSHATGIGGIAGAAGGDVNAIVAALKAEPHNYGDLMDDADLMDVAHFVSTGQVDMNRYIERSSKMPKGDKAKGEAYYNTICAGCHGKDGKLPDDMKPFGAQMGNPWEVMHKILNGQPDEQMPALRALDHQITVDIMAHLTTLPKE
jgi:mono/diheme cytochrome c family protein